MNIEKLRKRTPKRTARLSIRITSEDFDFLKKNKLSPTRIMDESIKQLRKKI